MTYFVPIWFPDLVTHTLRHEWEVSIPVFTRDDFTRIYSFSNISKYMYICVSLKFISWQKTGTQVECKVNAIPTLSSVLSRVNAQVRGLGLFHLVFPTMEHCPSAPQKITEHRQLGKGPKGYKGNYWHWSNPISKWIIFLLVWSLNFLNVNF